MWWDENKWIELKIELNWIELNTELNWFELILKHSALWNEYLRNIFNIIFYYKNDWNTLLLLYINFTLSKYTEKEIQYNMVNEMIKNCNYCFIWLYLQNVKQQ